MDRIRQMEVFIKVMESGNFTRAAEALAIPRSTVSTVIQNLEDRLRMQLLRRTTRRMVPTPEGERFLETAREIVDSVEAAEHMFRPQSAHLRGKLRVDMPSRIGRRIVIPALPDFLEANPDLTVEMSMTDQIVDLVSQGVDCLIRVGALESSDLICRKLGDVDLINCASPDYLRRHGTPRIPADLSRHCLVNYAARLPAETPAWEHSDTSGLHSIEMRAQICVDNAEAYIAAALAGLGIIQVPAFDVRDLLETGRLVEILSEFRAPPMQLSFLYARRRNVPARIIAFQDWVSAVMRKAGVT